MKAQITISPLLKAFESFDFNSMISTDLPIDEYSFVYDPKIGVLEMSMKYSSSIEGLNATITINPPKLGVFRLAKSNSKKIVIESRNNAGSYHYSNSVYSLAQTVSVISTSVACLALIMMLFSLLGAKVIGVEMMAVLQISFFGLVTASKMNPCIHALKNLSLVNGFNSIIMNGAGNDNFPHSFSALSLFPQFWENFNLSWIIIIIPFFVGLAMFAVSKKYFQEKEQQNTIRKVWTRIIG